MRNTYDTSESIETAHLEWSSVNLYAMAELNDKSRILMLSYV